MKTPRTDQKLLRNNRRGFVIAATLAVALAVVVGVLARPQVRDAPGWVGPVAYAGILVLGGIIGMAITGALVAHYALQANIRRETRVIDGTVDGK